MKYIGIGLHVDILFRLISTSCTIISGHGFGVDFGKILRFIRTRIRSQTLLEN